MSQSSVRLALDGLLASFRSGGQLVTEAERYAPTPGTGYLHTELAAYERTAEGLGISTVFMESGSYQVSVVRPDSEGLVAASSLADLVVAVFKRGVTVALGTGGVLTIETASAKPAIASGGWLTVPVVVSWFCTAQPEG